MSINLFDEVLLKDGRSACITEIFDESHFLADVGFEKWIAIEISIDDIEKVLKHG